MKVYQNINPDIAGANLKVLDIKYLTESTYILTLEKKDLRFFAGQHFSLGLEDGFINREYSVYSGANEKNISFLIKKIEGGNVSNALGNKSLKKVKVHGPYSNFVIKEEDLDKRFLFIATGTGIAPFSSFVSTYKNLNYKLIHGVRYENEKYEIDKYEKNITLCVSRKSRTKYKRVTECLEDLNVEQFDQIYLCGNSMMIIDVQNILQNKQYSGEVKEEVFF